MDNMDKPVMLELDDLDFMLAKELELDARQSSGILARKLGVSKTTIQRRVQRLLDEGVITIVTLPDPLSLGFQAPVAMGLNITPGKAGEVAECLRSNKNILNITLTTGRYDAMIIAIFPDPLKLIDFLDEDLSHVPYLVNVDTMTCLQGAKSSWKYLNDDTDRYKEPKPRNLDELDIGLMKELELCPRESVTNLGKKLGVDRKIAGRRLQSLLADNVIRVVSIAKPSLFGFSLEAVIFVRVQPGEIMPVANSLINERRIRHVSITTGFFELLLNAVFRDIEEMSDFLMNRLGNYPGVVSHETMIKIAIVKHSFSVLT